MKSYIVVKYNDETYDTAECADGEEKQCAEEMGAELIEICGTPEKAERTATKLNRL